MHRVTVGIPTYNRPENLREALGRITRQTYSDLQIIISDNCSEDEAAVRRVVEEFSKSDARIHFVRQEKNLGAIRNLKFLLDQAASEYFLWAADDDQLEPTYIEKLVTALDADSTCSLAISGYDVLDTLTTPSIYVSYIGHLRKLPSPGLFRRLFNYIQQPEYYGKIRILWGVGRTEFFRRAFNDTLAALEPAQGPRWHLMPIELRMLVHGNLAVVDETLFHSVILPSSDGYKEAIAPVGAMARQCHEGFSAYRKVIGETPLSAWQKFVLRLLLTHQELHSLARVVPFYFLRNRAPGLARIIKVIWFRVLVFKGRA